MSFKVYTKTGDKGTTSLVDGTRVSKSDILINAYGEVDTLNSFLGELIAVCELNLNNFNSFQNNILKQLSFLKKVQSELLNLGSNLACPSELHKKFKIPSLSLDLINEMESQIDLMDETLEPLKNFILPRGGLASSKAHILRCKTRECERFLNNLEEENNAYLIDAKKLLNRLSDYFFIFARYLNKSEGLKDVIWSTK